jgi:flavin-dependent dehydrogenase
MTARPTSAIGSRDNDTSRIVGAMPGDEVRATADRRGGRALSWLAREVGAKVVEERNQYVGTTYHAEWEDVEPLSAEHPHALAVYNTVKGLLVIPIPIDTRKYIVAMYLTKERANFGPQKVESIYLEGLQSIPEVWARLKNARKVTQVVGVKGIENGYRTPYGNGWVLAGDAVHYKDPIDGQGIYDALLGTRILAEAIRKWKLEGRPWEESMTFYQNELEGDAFDVRANCRARQTGSLRRAAAVHHQDPHSLEPIRPGLSEGLLALHPPRHRAL